MKFRTAYSERIVFASPSGCRYRKQYIRGFDKEGNKILVENGVEDLFDTVQKAAPGNCIEDLIRRAESGDATAIPEVNAVDALVDLTHMPTDLLEAHMMLANAQERYKTLPKELRAQFGNTFAGMLKAIGDGSFTKALTQPVKSSDKTTGFTPDQIEEIKKLIGGSHNG